VLDNYEQAISLYNKAIKVPQDVTRATVLKDTHIAIDGTLYVPESQASTLFIHAFDTNDYIPQVIKIPFVNGDEYKEVEFYESFKEQIERNRYAFVPVKLLSLSGSIEKQFSPKKELTRGILMPRYGNDLSSLPRPIESSFCRRAFPRLLEAVKFMSSVGWMHGDIKP
jgi:hypothetical protein